MTGMENNKRQTKWDKSERRFPVSARVAVCVDPSIGRYPVKLIRGALPGSEVRPASPAECRELLSGRTDRVDLIVVVDRGKWPLDDGSERDIAALEEGAFKARTDILYGMPFLRIVGGGTAGAVYGVREVFEERVRSMDSGGFAVPPLDLHEAPGLPYRLLWTWDHSTNWYLEQIGLQDIGALNYYLKPESGFLEDYKRLVDFMSENRISAVTIYGFLRDNHGGVDAAKELCSYAAERGVRILPGVGINAYGGIYWEGNSPYNLSNWLRKNPQLRAVLGKRAAFHIPDLPELWFPDNQYTDTSCPSKPENIAYHEEAIAWLAETFDIGGINFETGDYGTCHCDECTTRRSENTTWSFGDMALFYPRLFEAAKRSGKDLWLVVEAYWDTILDLDSLAPLASLPDEAIYQYCINRSYWPRVKRELTADHIARLPRSQNIFRTHMGSQWNGERDTLTAKRFAEMSSIAYETGMKGLTIFGEVSAFNPANEINYLAFSRFGWDPKLTWQTFVQRDLAPRFGGTMEAEKYMDLLDTPDEKNALERATDEAKEIGAATAGEPYRRWIHLQDRLFRKKAMLRGNE
jgi:hypothetical protein